MVKEIEDNIDDLIKEKDEYFRSDGQQVSKQTRIPDAQNVY